MAAIPALRNYWMIYITEVQMIESLPPITQSSTNDLPFWNRSHVSSPSRPVVLSRFDIESYHSNFAEIRQDRREGTASNRRRDRSTISQKNSRQSQPWEQNATWTELFRAELRVYLGWTHDTRWAIPDYWRCSILDLQRQIQRRSRGKEWWCIDLWEHN